MLSPGKDSLMFLKRQSNKSSQPDTMVATQTVIKKAAVPVPAVEDAN